MAGGRRLAAWLPLVLALSACGAREPVVVGRPGLNPGEFDTPRGLDARHGLLAVVDKSGRVQVFEADGALRREFRCMPEDARRGFPLDVHLADPDGAVWVAHTHRGQVLHYDEQGREDRIVGDYGMEPGEFGLPQRLLRDDAGWLVSDFGFPANRRLHRFDANWKFVRTLGGPGTDMEFHRPLGIATTRAAGGETLWWIADTDHRLVRMNGQGFKDVVGSGGDGVGELRFPTGVDAHPDGGVVVAEAGNHRIQWFGNDGVSRGT
ncbi:MAG: NHL repeat-containing protein, partial [Planctomycetota bacterium]